MSSESHGAADSNAAKVKAIRTSVGWFLKGEAKAPARDAKLQKKRCGRAKKAGELERLKGVELIPSYAALKGMGNDALSDQLKIYKLIHKLTGFTTTGTGHAYY